MMLHQHLVLWNGPRTMVEDWVITAGDELIYEVWGDNTVWIRDPSGKHRYPAMLVVPSRDGTPPGEER